MEKELLLKLIGVLIEKPEKNALQTNIPTTNPYVGKYVIVRGPYCGVRAGVLSDATPGSMILKEARMLRYRWASEGTGLSGVAETGLRLEKKSDIEINKTIAEVMLTDQSVSTIYKTTDFVEKQIRSREVK